MSYLPSFYFCCLMCKRAMGNNCDTCLTGPLGELHWLTHVKPLEKCLARSEDSINANLVNSSSTWRYCSPKVLYQQAGNFTSDLVVRFLVSIIWLNPNEKKNDFCIILLSHCQVSCQLNLSGCVLEIEVTIYKGGSYYLPFRLMYKMKSKPNRKDCSKCVLCI